MRWTTWSVAAVAAGTFGLGYAASVVTRVPVARPAIQVEPVSRRYALRNAAVADAAGQITTALSRAAPHFEVDAEANAFTAVCMPEVHDRIAEQLQTLDARPVMVEIACTLARTGPAGERTILSRPHVQTLDGSEAFISIGQQGGEGIEVTLLPKVILPEHVQTLARSSANSHSGKDSSTCLP